MEFDYVAFLLCLVYVFVFSCEAHQLYFAVISKNKLVTYRNGIIFTLFIAALLRIFIWAKVMIPTALPGTLLMIIYFFPVWLNFAALSLLSVFYAHALYQDYYETLPWRLWFVTNVIFAAFNVTIAVLLEEPALAQEEQQIIYAIYVGYSVFLDTLTALLLAFFGYQFLYNNHSRKTWILPRSKGSFAVVNWLMVLCFLLRSLLVSLLSTNFFENINETAPQAYINFNGQHAPTSWVILAFYLITEVLPNLSILYLLYRREKVTKRRRRDRLYAFFRRLCSCLSLRGGTDSAPVDEKPLYSGSEKNFDKSPKKSRKPTKKSKAAQYDYYYEQGTLRREKRQHPGDLMSDLYEDVDLEHPESLDHPLLYPDSRHNNNTNTMHRPVGVKTYRPVFLEDTEDPEEEGGGEEYDWDYDPLDPEAADLTSEDYGQSVSLSSGEREKSTSTNRSGGHREKQIQRQRERQQREKQREDKQREKKSSWWSHFTSSVFGNRDRDRDHTDRERLIAETSLHSVMVVEEIERGMMMKRERTPPPPHWGERRDEDDDEDDDDEEDEEDDKIKVIFGEQDEDIDEDLDDEEDIHLNITNTTNNSSKHSVPHLSQSLSHHSLSHLSTSLSHQSHVYVPGTAQSAALAAAEAALAFQQSQLGQHHPHYPENMSYTSQSGLYNPQNPTYPTGGPGGGLRPSLSHQSLSALQTVSGIRRSLSAHSLSLQHLQQTGDTLSGSHSLNNSNHGGGGDPHPVGYNPMGHSMLAAYVYGTPYPVPVPVPVPQLTPVLSSSMDNGDEDNGEPRMSDWTA